MAALKELLDKKALKSISNQLVRVWPRFNQKIFQKNVLEYLSQLELKDRVRLIAHQMQKQMPCSAEVLLTLKEALYCEKQNPQGLQGFQVWPLTEYVAYYGLQHFEEAMVFLEEATQVFTAEFAVRPFFRKDPEKMLRQFLIWTDHPSEHLRRLASEGSRPLLPWGEKLELISQSPELSLPILLKLATDPSSYVQKSVANHWNDHSKNHPLWTLQQLKTWPNPWVQKHALRTLVKKGNPEALAILGYKKSKHISLKNFSISPSRLTWNMKIQLKASLLNSARTPQNVMVDLVLRLPSAKSAALREKVFKGGQYQIQNTKEIHFALPFRKISTRQYYPGKYFVHFRINGVDFPSKTFTFHDKI